MKPCFSWKINNFSMIQSCYRQISVVQWRSIVASSINCNNSNTSLIWLMSLQMPIIQVFTLPVIMSALLVLDTFTKVPTSITLNGILVQDMTNTILMPIGIHNIKIFSLVLTPFIDTFMAIILYMITWMRWMMVIPLLMKLWWFLFLLVLNHH